MENRLKYRDETDRSYGATGMALSLVVLDGQEMLVGLSIDGEPSEIMEMHPSFYFTGNPGFSATSAWKQLRNNFGLSVAMLIGNVMSRTMVQDRKEIDSDLRSFLTDRAMQEGIDSIALEEDEIREIFDQEYRYLFNVFNHRRLVPVVHEFAEILRERRKMSRLEILDRLRTFNII